MRDNGTESIEAAESKEAAESREACEVPILVSFLIFYLFF